MKALRLEGLEFFRERGGCCSWRVVIATMRVYIQEVGEGDGSVGHQEEPVPRAPRRKRPPEDSASSRGDGGGGGGVLCRVEVTLPDSSGKGYTWNQLILWP